MPTIVSKQEYFDAALEVLAKSGFKSLNIGVMCRALGVTSGSFYHYFGSWDGFVAQLLEFWENKQVVVLADMDFGSGEPERDVKSLRELTLGLNHEAEAAIRSWGGNNEAVRAAQTRVDDSRIKTVHKAVNRTIRDSRKSDVITALGMDMLVGYQQRLGHGDRVGFDKVLDEYLKLVYSYKKQ